MDLEEGVIVIQKGGDEGLTLDTQRGDREEM
jgi:hypothetical protein